jgi:cytidylate kinase
MIIAIDGPAGSGKSTVAKLAARRLGFAYLDTGAMYRAVAWRALAQRIDLSEPLSEVSKERIRAIARIEPIRFGFTRGDPLPSQVLINDEDVTAQIRTPQTDKAVSPVSADPGVREALTEQQRDFGREYDTVMEGRDIGTVVFPDAELKVFLTASAEERARRRATQNAAKVGRDAATAEETAIILADLLRRDRYDSSREVAPLVPAPDSWELDSTDMTIDEVVAAIVDRARAVWPTSLGSPTVREGIAPGTPTAREGIAPGTPTAREGIAPGTPTAPTSGARP